MQKQYIGANGEVDRRQLGEMPPWQSKCENGFSIRLVFSGLLFFAFIGLFSGDLGF